VLVAMCLSSIHVETTTVGLLAPGSPLAPPSRA
jgi:hypothetical protein